LPFSNFVPGDYLFNNSSMGCTFDVHIVPEPSLIALAGICALTLICERRTRIVSRGATDATFAGHAI
jgi:hypothetical protein